MYTTKVEYNDEIDEYFVILPTEFMDDLGIKEGDELVWQIEDDRIYLSKNNS